MAVAVPVAPVRTTHLVWALVAAAIAVQIVYPLMPEAWRTTVTVTSVLVFFIASVADAVRVHGPMGGVLLIAIASGGGFFAEVVGVASGWPFGGYTYNGTLGPQLMGVPLVVPLAWAMMAWPALVVARTLARRSVAVIAVGAVALSAWDVFLDPQMVAAGHWSWADPGVGLPLIPGIPLSNYLGWLLVSVAVIGLLHATLPRENGPSAPASTLYLWVYASSVMGHAVFFGLPGSALIGALLMGAVAIPFAITLWRRRG